MAGVSKGAGFSGASSMPEPEELAGPKRVGLAKKQHVVTRVTPNVSTTVHHMVMKHGHSDCGSHALSPEFEQQVKRKLYLYNDVFHGKEGSDASCPVDGSLREFQRVFKRFNLFRMWEQFDQGAQL